MKGILKPIFEMITGEYILFDDILYNYIAMGIIGIIAFKIAWDFVGKLYNYGIITGKSFGSILHWGIRLVVFSVIFYILSFIIWVTKFIYTYRSIIISLMIIIVVIIIIFRIVKNKNTDDINKSI